ncbi:MAG: hypothetical protein LJF30_19005 [Acidobacteria bacterium]|jgi:hypothetical protein|nr:hypothetical protein [Acidobacteriota bacterium]
MLKARLGKEVVLRIENEVGVLDQIARTVAEKGVDILATSAWTEGAVGVVHLVTDDNLRVVGALRARNYDPKESDVVLADVPHKPGMLRHVTERLARGSVDVHHLYATTVPGQGESLVVLATANNDHAVVLLNT